MDQGIGSTDIHGLDMKGFTNTSFARHSFMNMNDQGNEIDYNDGNNLEDQYDEIIRKKKK